MAIKINDIKENAQIQLESGTIFVIENIKDYNGLTIVTSHIKDGSKGNYQDEINDAVNFFNEENSKLI
jgi:hypothetical protein